MNWKLKVISAAVLAVICFPIISYKWPSCIYIVVIGIVENDYYILDIKPSNRNKIIKNHNVFFKFGITITLHNKSVNRFCAHSYLTS